MRGVFVGGSDRSALVTLYRYISSRSRSNPAQASGKADDRAADLAPTIRELQASGATSLRAIAAGLNAQRIPTSRGGEWTATQVMRVLERLAA